MGWLRLVRSLTSAQLSVAAVWLLAGTSGCAAFKASQQPDRKDLSVLKPGTPRTHVIAELGAPIWSKEHPNGSTTDIFAFKQGYSKGAKTGRVLFHSAADVVTGGLWEVAGIPIETVADGADVKVVVTSEANGYVAQVDPVRGADAIEPRPMLARLKNKSKTTLVSHRTPKPTAANTDDTAHAADTELSEE